MINDITNALLSDQYKTRDVQVKKKLYTNIATEKLSIPINIPCDKGKTHTVKNQTGGRADRKRIAQEGKTILLDGCTKNVLKKK